MTRFFESFSFEFDAASLDTFKENAKSRLGRLGVDETGWQGLCDAVRRWATERDTPNRRREITIDDVKNALGWSKIKPLRQDFLLPEDFVLFDSSLHKALVDEVKSPHGGIKVLYGSPGFGKSTYLSFLYRELSKAGCCCLRHHYFLQLGDVERYPRLTYERASESIITTYWTKHRQNFLRGSHFSPGPTVCQNSSRKRRIISRTNKNRSCSLWTGLMK